MILALPSYAQESDTDPYSSEPGTTGLPEEVERPGEIPVSEDTTPVGIVDDIILTGTLTTSRWAVLRQMTFKVGDQISLRDIDFCENRLRGLNGIYWYAKITWEPAEEEGHVIVTVEVAGRRTWFIYPSIESESILGTSINGGAIGDRNFLGSADMVVLSAFPGGNDYLYSVMWMDPQFNGGHQTASVNAWMLDSYNTIRTDNLLSTHESYNIDRNGFRLDYRTTYHGNMGVGVGYRWEDVTTSKLNDPFGQYGDDDTFFLSGADITRGHVGALSFECGQYRINSRFFPTAGYYWNTYHEISGPFTLSDFSFTRHTFNAAYFQDIYRGRNVLCGRVMYSAMTGSPPNYEMNEFGYHVRGYTSGVFRGKSLFAMNLEYRFIAEPDVLQGVLFADWGRAWEDVSFGFEDLEFGYGAGIRIYTAHLIPYNLLIRVDYGIGTFGEEVTIGFNHFF
jgi:outer membrane protein assembly factor BamA